MSGRPGRPRRVRNVGGDREERVEEDNADNPRDQGPQEAIGDQGVQRAITIERSIFRAAAVCLTALCVLGVVRTTDRVMDYNSAIKELTLDRDQCKTSFDNMTLERDQLYKDLCGTAVKSCPSGWKTFGCSCYYRTAEWKTWEEHRELCLKTGAHLVIINSKEEQEFIRGLTAGGYSSYIGLKRISGNWTWVDGTPLTTTQYWNSGEPENREVYNCAFYWYNGGGLANGPCTLTVYGICEK